MSQALHSAISTLFTYSYKHNTQAHSATHFNTTNSSSCTV